MKLTIWEYINLGRPQWRGQSDPLRKFVWAILGAPDIHTRVRNAHIINKVLSLVIAEDLDVIDLGAGRGVGLFFLADKFNNWRLTGIELDQDMYRSSQQAAQQGGYENLHFIQADLEALDPKHKYSLALCSDVLEHIHDDISLLKKIHAMLTPGSHLIIHVPRKRQDQWRFLDRYKDHTVAGHVDNEYTKEQLTNALESAGFELIDLEHTFGKAAEIAFEINHLFWDFWTLRQIIAVLTSPLTIPLGYLDLLRHSDSGNSLLALAQRPM